MPRRKLSEYRAKQIVSSALEIPYTGWENVDGLDESGRYVVKVDQAVKKRFKNGLVGLNLSKPEVAKWIEQTKQKGFDSFIIEPFQKHDDSDERYLSLTRDARGMHLTLSASGGVNIEEQAATLEAVDINDSTDWHSLAEKSGLSEERLYALVQVFTDNFFTLLEINPYLVSDGQPQLLDVAVEVDDAASLLVDTWHAEDLRRPPRLQSGEEATVAALNENSPASFAFQTINPDGSLFVLLSGGGASVTVCDEIYSAGYGKELANYGEYSGNPTEEEAYIYTAAVLRSLLESKAPKKALFIGGAVANFTDIAKTFAGLTKAIDEYGEQLKAQQVRVVVRRGGPNQEKGLENIRKILEKYNLAAAVFNQTTTIDAAVERLIKEAAPAREKVTL